MSAALICFYFITACPALADPFEIGAEYFLKGEFSEAEAAFRAAVEADPNSARAYYFHGLSASKIDRTSEAAASFQQALNLDPEQSDAYLQLGIARYKLDQFEEAAQALDEAIKRLPEDASAIFFRGLTEQALEQHATSIPYFEDAGELDPNYTQLAHFNIGLAHYRMGENELANDAFARAVTLEPDSKTAGYARTFLDRLATEEEDKRPWSLSARIGTEYSDNVTRSQIDQVSAQGDVAAKFDFSGDYVFLDGPELSLEAGYGFSQSIYESLTNFNLQSHRGSLGVTRKFGSATLGLDYGYTRSLLGGFDFLGDHNLRLSVRFPMSSSWYVSASYDVDGKDFRRSGDGDRDAIQHGAAIDNFLFFNNYKSYVIAGFQLESENTNGPQFDYLAETAKIEFRTPLEFFDPDLILRASYRFRHRDYSNVTASIGSERQENRHTALLQLNYDINDYVELQFKYRYVNSISNLRSVDYVKNIVGFSVGLQY